MAVDLVDPEIFGQAVIHLLSPTVRAWDSYPEHVFDENGRCWCEPTLEYEDPETGNRVWSHNNIQ